MTSDVRRIFDPNRFVPVASNGAPPAQGSKDVVRARNDLGEYLDAALMRPLYHTGEQHQARVEQALDTMTPAERVYLEIEMQERARRVHSFDYDPLR